MRKSTLVPLLLLSFLTGSVGGQVVINEFMASNRTAVEDPDEPGGFDDWIELYNAGPTSVDLDNLYLTDDLSNPTRWRIAKGVSLAARGHLLIWADDDDEQGSAHTNFNLRAAGGDNALYDALGETRLHSIQYGPQ